jgi:hypothetical protein
MSESSPVCPAPEQPENINCHKSPCPDDFTKPPFPENAYYSHVPKDQLDKINGDRAKAESDAEIEKIEAYGQAFEHLQAAKAAYDAAARKKDQDLKLLDLRCKNKKTELLLNYKNGLMDQLPKGCVSANKESDPIEDRVPKDKLAISVAGFYKALADEELNYSTKFKEIKDLGADAEHAFRKANIAYIGEVCLANATKKQKVAAAEIVRRTKLSEQLQLLCK